MKKRLAFILGIRPDVIRASIILNILRSSKNCDLKFIWSGQHYSDNLKDIFFRELNVEPPEIELNAGGNTDADISSTVIAKLFPVLQELKPEAAVFLGDTNTVMGCLAAAQLNIPIVHIEGCMRSYDWRMPEEKYRTTIDHLSDVIYTYFEEYKQQGIDEGLNPNSIVVTTNPIVDVLNKYYFEKKSYYDQLAKEDFFSRRGIEKNQYYAMTCHRRENVHELQSLKNILSLIGATDRKIYFPASYRTQKVLKENSLRLPDNVIMVDPVGYEEILVLMTNSRGVITDSGTVVEETCVLQIPSLQIRKSTERPQVYDVGSCVKFDPTEPERYPHQLVFDKLESLYGKTWPNPLGDGKASERIANDLLSRLDEGRFRNHRPSDYHLDIRRSFREDGL
jgi:UDP-N-acetylglucosamine 2-epimerase (non-hydrolysing)